MGRYRTIVVDPPWAYQDLWDHYLSYSKASGQDKAIDRRALQPLHYRRGAAANYTTLSLEDLAALPISKWVDDDAHLYLWTTNAFMVEAHNLAVAWDFKVKTILTWVKPRLGMGTYYRNNTEHVLFAVKGSLKTLRKDCRTAFEGAQGRHSEKPQAFYDMVETMSPGPYLDVFARRQRMGWDVWGNEVYCAEGLASPASSPRRPRRGRGS